MAFNRAVVLVDMDCFYVQVEQRRDPEYKGKPCAVVQYKKYRGGGIIAVGYEARACGVTRGMMGDDAKKVCPQIHLFRVPESNGKANLDRYREAGAEVINVLSQFGGRVERASIDEAYIDLTDFVNKIISDKKEEQYITQEKLPNTHIIGYPQIQEEGADKAFLWEKGVNEWLEGVNYENLNLENKRLCITAAITEEIRAAVFHQTGFRCSAGISHNKMLSKLACGINKPNKQTILPKTSISGLFETMKIAKVRNLGGKLGKSLAANFNVEFMNQLKEIPAEQLTSAYGQKTTNWLKEVCQGIDYEPIKERHVAQSIGCGKNFFGPDALNTKTKVKKWMDALLIELSERLEKDKDANSRIARSLSVHVKLETGKSFSRSGPLIKYDRHFLLDQCLQLIRSLDSMTSQDEKWYPAIVQLSVNAKKFDTIGGSITAHTKNMPSVSTGAPSSGGNSISEDFKNGNVDFDDKNVKNGFSKYWNFSKLPKDIEDSDTDKPGYSRGEGNRSKMELEFPPKIKVSPKADIVRTKVGQKGFFSSRAQSDVKHFRTKKEGFDAFKMKTEIDSTPLQNTGGLIPSKSRHNSNCSECAFSVEDSHNEQNFQQTPSIWDSKHEINSEIKFTKDSHQGVDDDVMFLSENRSKISETKLSCSENEKSGKRKSLCKIDEMLLREKENSLIKPQKKLLSLPDGPVSHPTFGEIDKDVFNDLPPDIQNEIINSLKISSPIKSTQNSSMTSQKRKDSSKGQKLISNFIPLSPSSLQSLTPTTSSTKRKSLSPKCVKNKKQKTSAKQKNPMKNFTSKAQKDAVPLGFFRQRSQLSSAIAKALSRESSNFNKQN